MRVDPAAALAQAEEIDRRRKAGKPLGRLAGLPVAVKDVLCTQGEPTTCASRMLENFRPPYDATVVAKLKAADAVLIGRTNMDEFAMGGSNENSAFFPTHNPWDLSRVPGGSSGGSAAAVAARMAPLAVGSDTGGSIRCPAALCGVSGLKPTYGRVSRYGLVAFASSLDQIGPMGQTAEDCALLLEVLAGHDPMDSTSIDLPVPRYSETIRQPLEGLRLGLVREHFGAGLDAEVEAAVREAVARLRVAGGHGQRAFAAAQQVRRGHVLHHRPLRGLEQPGPLRRRAFRLSDRGSGARVSGQWSVVGAIRRQSVPISPNPAAALTLALSQRERGLPPTVPWSSMYRRSRSEGFGAEVKRRIMLGTYALSAGYYDAYYKKALKVRRLIREDFDRAFEEVDLIVGPVTPTPAFKLGERIDDPLAMYFSISTR